MRVAIFLVSFGKRGELLAHVSQRGRVTPAKGMEGTDSVLGIVEHVKEINRERLTGRAYLERVQRSYTNGVINVALIVS